MARQSLESTRMALNALMLEQTRDRDALQRLMNHCSKMVDTLQNMLKQEEARIETEAAERIAAARKMFKELIAVEQERKERLALHISDISGEGAPAGDHAGNGHDLEIDRPEDAEARE